MDRTAERLRKIMSRIEADTMAATKKSLAAAKTRKNRANMVRSEVGYLIQEMDNRFSNIERGSTEALMAGGIASGEMLDTIERRLQRAAPGFNIFFSDGPGDEVDYIFDRLYGGAK